MLQGNPKVAIIVLLLQILSAAALDLPGIEWKQDTLVLLKEGAGYGRMIRLSSGEILFSYQDASISWIRKSRDEGCTWSVPVQVSRYKFGVAANPETLELQDGTILLFYNERPRVGEHRFSITFCSSRDGGETWSEPRCLYSAGREFGNGCWEPAAIQLRSGEIQLFFANEGPFRDSKEQEISLMRSFDQGNSWTRPKRISFRAGKRDGMPVPLVLQGGKGILIAIEDNGLGGRLKPAIVRSGLSENWNQPFAAGDSPRRWSALKTPLPDPVYAGAPYICQLPSGRTVLSVQSDEGGRQEPQMVVYLGDSYARNFSFKSVPFELSSHTAGLWNSLFVKAPDTVTAISGTEVNGVKGVWAIDGRVKLLREHER